MFYYLVYSYIILVQWLCYYSLDFCLVQRHLLELAQNHHDAGDMHLLSSCP
jgi:hypothetical protein